MDNKSEVTNKVPQKSGFDKVRSNPWIISTIVFAILSIVLIFSLTSSGGTGAAVSGQTAANNLISFVNAQGKGNATFISAEKDGTLYKVTVGYNNQSIPVYVTTDGKYLITTPIPLTAAATTNTNTQTNTQKAQQQPTTVPKSDKPKVELFVMAYCPYGTQIEKGIIPVVNALKDKIDFSVKFVFYSMHGQKEIDENTRQYCIQKEQSVKYISYLSCFLNNSDATSCLTSAGIDKTKLDSCVVSADKQFNITANFNDKSSWLNGQFPKYDVYVADNQKYNVQGSPTLVINGVQADSGRDSASLLKTICAAFNTAPSECNTKLSSTSPDPGFGYSASASSSGSGNTAAGCGA